jgi:hypothetical protein
VTISEREPDSQREQNKEHLDWALKRATCFHVKIEAKRSPRLIYVRGKGRKGRRKKRVKEYVNAEMAMVR